MQQEKWREEYLRDILVKLSDQDDIPGQSLRRSGLMIAIYLSNQDPTSAVHSGHRKTL